MSVVEAFTLPGQPTTGSAEYVALGGNGYSAPFAAYSVSDAAVTGDAGGGNQRVVITMDVRYVALVAFVSFNMSQVTAADADYRLFITADPATATIAENAVATKINATVSSITIGKTIVPPAVLLPAGKSSSVELRVLNVDTDVMRLSTLIYLFRHDVRQVAPIGPLLWARGAF